MDAAIWIKQRGQVKVLKVITDRSRLIEETVG